MSSTALVAVSPPPVPQRLASSVSPQRAPTRAGSCSADALAAAVRARLPLSSVLCDAHGDAYLGSPSPPPPPASDDGLARAGEVAARAEDMARALEQMVAAMAAAPGVDGEEASRALSECARLAAKGLDAIGPPTVDPDPDDTEPPEAPQSVPASGCAGPPLPQLQGALGSGASSRRSSGCGVVAAPMRQAHSTPPRPAASAIGAPVAASQLLQPRSLPAEPHRWGGPPPRRSGGTARRPAHSPLPRAAEAARAARAEGESWLADLRAEAAHLAPLGSPQRPRDGELRTRVSTASGLEEAVTSAFVSRLLSDGDADLDTLLAEAVPRAPARASSALRIAAAPGQPPVPPAAAQRPPRPRAALSPTRPAAALLLRALRASPVPLSMPPSPLSTPGGARRSPAPPSVPLGPPCPPPEPAPLPAPAPAPWAAEGGHLHQPAAPPLPGAARAPGGDGGAPPPWLSSAPPPWLSVLFPEMLQALPQAPPPQLSPADAPVQPPAVPPLPAEPPADPGAAGDSAAAAAPEQESEEADAAEAAAAAALEQAAERATAVAAEAPARERIAAAEAAQRGELRCAQLSELSRLSSAALAAAANRRWYREQQGDAVLWRQAPLGTARPAWTHRSSPPSADWPPVTPPPRLAASPAVQSQRREAALAAAAAARSIAAAEHTLTASALALLTPPRRPVSGGPARHM
eukprot:TRINITY_DN13111_c0_g1_i2.p1 TRINITY_DN13111_c0_g1~~TRINITY_DN13111_c0_g1_i2.p1  ORF type:complete len:718 (+),score=137.45 TRINITY_DN13111_c0_g1_i2:79-2154(+)